MFMFIIEFLKVIIKNYQTMSHVLKTEGLNFKSPKKAPSRKVNPVINEIKAKRPLKSASKNKISIEKLLPKRSSSR